MPSRHSTERGSAGSDSTSYVRENSDAVGRLTQALRAHGIEVWLDKTQIKPGSRWADAIREGISQGDFYIACFSVEYLRRSRTYMNEELTLAIEELRQRPTDRAWFIPVLLSNVEIPARNIELTHDLFIKSILKSNQAHRSNA
ncbi:MAG TPA: toll/interleukin-1 receptor domain-containing protein [Pyrinomonadaceae bacterium]|nr:toll/interleukin-1 receptor domain-containing protein [Pyrinomonadaceae bacterium]